MLPSAGLRALLWTLLTSVYMLTVFSIKSACWSTGLNSHSTILCSWILKKEHIYAFIQMQEYPASRAETDAREAACAAEFCRIALINNPGQPLCCACVRAGSSLLFSVPLLFCGCDREEEIRHQQLSSVGGTVVVEVLRLRRSWLLTCRELIFFSRLVEILLFS